MDKQTCPTCESKRTEPNREFSTRDLRIQFRCRDCGETFRVAEPLRHGASVTMRR